ncbi:UNVERIFIED_CONTAM: hypothetical protein O8I53_13050 [Campylobacter lari]
MVKKHNDYLIQGIFKPDTRAFLVSSEKRIGLDELIEYIQDILY